MDPETATGTVTAPRAGQAVPAEPVPVPRMGMETTEEDADPEEIVAAEQIESVGGMKGVPQKVRLAVIRYMKVLANLFQAPDFSEYLGSIRGAAEKVEIYQKFIREKEGQGKIAASSYECMRRTLCDILRARDQLGAFCSQESSRLNRVNRFQPVIAFHYLKKPEILIKFFSDLPEGWSLTGGIRKSGSSSLKLCVPVLPFWLEDRGLRVGFSGLKIDIRTPTSLGDEGVLSVRVKGGVASTDIKDFPELPMDGINGQFIAYPYSRLHPHVSRDSICFGSAGPAMSVALNNLDIPTIFHLAESVLHSYERGGAYEILERWAPVQGLRCSAKGCGAWYPQEKASGFWVCPRCKLSMCPGCREALSPEAKGDITAPKYPWCSLCVSDFEQKKKEKKKEPLLCPTCRSWKEDEFQWVCRKCKLQFCTEHMCRAARDRQLCFSNNCSGCSPRRLCAVCAGERKTLLQTTEKADAPAEVESVLPSPTTEPGDIAPSED